MRLRQVVYEYRESNGWAFAFADGKLICAGDIQWMPDVLTQLWPLEVVIRMSVELLTEKAA